MNLLQNFKFICIFLIILLLFPQRVYAYIDPGTGSYIFQIAIATLVGVLFSIKVFGRSVKSFLTNIFVKTQKEEKRDEHL